MKSGTDVTMKGMRPAATAGHAAGRQTTFKNRISCDGVGLHSGEPVRMTFHPAAADSGISFRRTDVGGQDPVVNARYDNVTETRLGTTISNKDGVSIATVEHLMAALSGCGVDNAVIEVDGPEIPVMDGSAAPFVFLIECAGIHTFKLARRVLRILKPVEIRDGEKLARLEPDRGFSLDLEIDFESAAIGQQRLSLNVGESTFKNEVARCRTFGFLEEVDYLKSIGLARGGSLENAVVVSGDKVLNEEGLRLPDEFVRHKVLDAIGDLALAGRRVEGRFVGRRSGHSINNLLLRTLFSQPEAYELVDHFIGDAVGDEVPIPHAATG